MTGATLMTHRTIPAAINTNNRPTPSRIRGAFSRVQKRCFGDIDDTSLSGSERADLLIPPLGVVFARFRACWTPPIAACP